MKVKLRIHKVVAMLCVLCMMLTAVPITASAEENVTYITTKEELNGIRNNLNGNYKLANDIDLSGYTLAPIGTQAAPFTGTFDGNGKTIRNLVISRQTSSYVGLFGANRGTVKNLTIDGADILGTKGVAAVAGASNGTIENCHVVNSIVAGYNNTSSVSNLYNNGWYIGAVVGNNSGAVTKCSAVDSFVNGVRFAGGLVGANLGNGSITLSFARNVEINSNTNGRWLSLAQMANNGAIVMINTDNFVYAVLGGLCGENQSSNENCYVYYGYVYPWDYAGGLVGRNSGTINNAYVANTGVSGYTRYNQSGYTFYPDGIDYVIGGDNYGGSFENVYNTEIANPSWTSTATRSYLVTGNEMKTQTPYVGFDFEQIWTFDGAGENGGYPVFKNTTEEPDTYTVTFNYNDDVTEPFVYEAEDQEIVDVPENPEREGYDFLGWYIEGSDTPCDSVTVNGSDVVVNARWEQKTVTVTLVTNDGNEPKEYTLAYGGSFTLPEHAPTLQGAEFIGWFDQKENKVSGTIQNIKEDMTITAEFAYFQMVGTRGNYGKGTLAWGMKVSDPFMSESFTVSKVGMKFIPEMMLRGEELTVDTQGTMNVDFSEPYGKTVLGQLTGLSSGLYDIDIMARGYAVIRNNQTQEEFVVYTNAVSTKVNNFK